MTLVQIEGVVELLVGFIALYKFYHRFISRQNIGFTQISNNYSRYLGSKIAVFIDNRSVSTVCIKEIRLIVQGKYSFLIKRYDEPLHLKPSNACRVESNPYTSTTNDLLLNQINIENTSLLIVTTRGNVVANKKCYQIWSKKRLIEKNYIHIATSQIILNDVVISSQVKYAICYQLDGSAKQILITSHGLMSEFIGGGNCLHSAMLGSIENLKYFFEQTLRPLNIENFVIWTPPNTSHYYKIDQKDFA